MPEAVLLLRFRRAADEPAHVEAYYRGGPKPGVSLCGNTMTKEQRVVAPYPVGDPKGEAFWRIVCADCGRLVTLALNASEALTA